MDARVGGCFCSSVFFFDQAMHLKPIKNIDVAHHALLIEQNFALGQIRCQRAAMIAGRSHGVIGGVERVQDRIEQGGQYDRRHGRQWQPEPADS